MVGGTELWENLGNSLTRLQSLVVGGRNRLLFLEVFWSFFYFFNLFIDLFNLSLILLHVHTGVGDTSIDGR